MDPFNGIIVQVISNDNALRFYNDPEAAENEDVYTRQRYIEAVTDATFWVKIMLTNEFDTRPLGNEDGVRVLINFDGSDRSWGKRFTKYELERGSRQGLPKIFEFKDLSHFSPETGKWMRSACTFGSLQMKESSNTDLSVTQAKNLGRIRVVIQRVGFERRHVPKVRSMQPFTGITEVSEKTLKGRDIVNSVNFTKGFPIEPPDSKPFRITGPLNGSAGKAMVYNIGYRSKHTLQMMGCISPDPLAALIAIPDDEATLPPTKRDESTPELLQQEVQDLRARLALLERGLNLESESSGLSTKVKKESARTVKREREGEENSGACQRRRTSVKIETVDLTDD